MIGGDLLLPLADDPGPSLRAGDHPVHGLGELLGGDQGLLASSGQDGRLVDQVRQVGAAEAHGLLGDGLQVGVLGQGLALGVHLEDLDAPADVGVVQGDLAVEASGPQESGVQDVGPVGGSQDDDVGVGIEAVHLDEDLVEGLLPLVVASAESGAPVSAHGVYLVDEDDAWGVSLGLVEEVPNAGGSDADEHLDELAAADVEEGDSGLTGDGSGQQGLPGARWAD